MKFVEGRPAIGSSHPQISGGDCLVGILFAYCVWLVGAEETPSVAPFRVHPEVEDFWLAYQTISKGGLRNSDMVRQGV